MSRGENLPAANLRQALEAETVPKLRAVACLISHRLPTRESDLVLMIDTHRSDPARLAAVLAALDDLGRATVAGAAHGNAQLLTDAFAAKHGAHPSRDGWFRGLLHGRSTILPPPNPAHLQGLAELPPDPGGDGTSTTVRLTEQAPKADLRAVPRLCETGKPHCSEKTRRPSATTVRAVSEALGESDFSAAEPIAAFAWPLLVQAGGRAELAGGRVQFASGPARAAGTATRHAAATVGAWTAARGPIDEFSRVEAIGSSPDACTDT